MTCTECGGSGPMWRSNDEWGLIDVCKSCVERKHKGIIIIMTLLNLGVNLLSFHLIASFGNALEIFLMMFLFLELIIIVGFWPYQ
jgi:hypothetical protein